MERSRKLKQFLKSHKVAIEVVPHDARFTSAETAEAEHIRGKNVAKVVIVKAKGKDVMLVLPADRSVDMLKLSALVGTQDVRLEEEEEFVNLFPDCEAGGMPPFGNLYQIPCYIDESLKKSDFVAFKGGNHRETMKIATADFFRIVKAETGDFSVLGRKITA